MVRQMTEAFNARKLLLGNLDPEVEWIEDQRYPGAGTFHGPGGVEQSIKKWWDAWADITMEIEEVIDKDERVVVAGRSRARGNGSDVAITAEFGAVYDFRDGRIVRVQVLAGREEALEAAGLSE